jgi:hypothetical protein
MIMQPWNMNLLIFFLDPRPFEELRPSLDEMFGGRFEQDLEYKAEGRLRYDNYVFGLNLSCVLSESWEEGNVYALSGSNDHCSRFDTLDVIDMTFHARKLLDSVGFTRIMTFEEFREESRRRSPG